MGTDEGATGAAEPDELDAPEPVRRRSTYLSRSRPSTTARSSLVHDEALEHDAADVHDDEELAIALENEISLLTASLPIVPASLFGATPAPVQATHSGSEAEREIAHEADTGNTLAAIERLEALLAAQHASTLPAAIGSATNPPTETAPIPYAPDSQSERTPVAQAIDQPERPRRRRRLFWLWFALALTVLAIVSGVGLVMAGFDPVPMLIAVVVVIVLGFIPLCVGIVTGAWRAPREPSAG